MKRIKIVGGHTLSGTINISGAKNSAVALIPAAILSDEQVEIDNIKFIHGRAEDFGKLEEYREKYDIATARAVAGLPVLMEFCVPFIKVGGYFVCLKGPNANLELEESKVAMNVLGVEFIEKINIELPESDLNHNILVFKKVKNTPDKYPRKAGKPAKSPIK